jgi:hypothetical protein
MVKRFAMKLFSVIALVAGVVTAQSAPPAGSVQGVPPGLIATPINPVPGQSAPPRKDIPAIAKAANGSIVSIVMSDKDGKPITQGSGFLVSNDGVVVTNYHVISEGSSAIVKFPDGAFYLVDGLFASDKARDVAIIKAHGENFRTVTLGNSDRVQVGEEIVAIGNPLSLESTVSNGIVSAIRTIEEEGGKFLQVTAPISPGSSGGPLFNMAGEVVGITTLKFKGGENLNFAIPINDAKLLLQKRSAKLQNLPNEADGATSPKGANTFVRFHIEAYNPNTGVAKVRYGNKLFTVTVLSAFLCKKKPLDEFDSDRDCEKVPAEVGTLVGQDIASDEELRKKGVASTFEGYQMTEMVSNLMLMDFGRDKNHTEVLRIEKIEEVNP